MATGFMDFQQQGGNTSVLDGILQKALSKEQKETAVSRLAATALMKDSTLLPSLMEQVAKAQAPVGNMSIDINKTMTAQPQQQVMPQPRQPLIEAVQAQPKTGLMQSDFMQNPVKGVGKGLANFMQSAGYGAIGKPINAGAEAGGGWQSYIGGALGEAAANRLKYGNTNYAARKESKLQFYNTDKDKQENEAAIDKSARSYDRSLELMYKRNELAEKKQEKKTILDQGMLDIREQKKARESLRTYSGDAAQVLKALDNLEKKTVNVLPGARRGVLEQIGAKTQIGFGRLAADKNIVRYDAAVNAELIPLARKLMEEKGPINESDVNRVEKALGQANLPIEDRMAIIGDLRSKVIQAIEFKRQAAGMSKEEFSKLYSSLAPKPENVTASGNTYRKVQ